MIYPEYYPKNNNNQYEKEVYESLYKAFANSEDFDVFFSRKFSGQKGYEKIDYEIDFLIADVRNGKLNGLAILEVKGNQLKYDGFKNAWFQDGREMKKSPTTQARSNMNSLIRRYPNIARNATIGWGVWFPRVLNPGNEYLPSELADYQFFDKLSNNYSNEKVHAFFDQLYELQPKRKGIEFKDYVVFKESMLRGLGYFVPLQKKIQSTNAQFVEMTNKQMEFVKIFGATNDIIVRGPAGSGKTIMAKTIAQEKSEEGASVLLLTYNRVLSNNIRYHLGRESNVKVSTYHSLAREIITENFDGWWEENSKNENFWTLDIPVKLLDVTEEKMPKFDCIVVDEAQDLRSEWYETLNKIVTADGGFYLFMDTDQDIFNTCTEINIGRRFFEFDLKENCRNTQEIISHLKSYVDRDIEAAAMSVKGEAIRKIDFTNDTDQMNSIKKEWLHLVENEGITPDQIVLMMNATKRDSCLSNTKKFGRHTIKAIDRSGRFDKRAVNYTSINTFKGLEADIVFIIDTDKPENPNKKVLYTQASRAKNLLYLFHKK